MQRNKRLIETVTDKNMKKKVWILNHYASDTYFDRGGRHYYFAKYLRRNGYEPCIFCCNSVHGKQAYYFDDQRLWHVHQEKEIDVPYIFVRGRVYSGNGRQRVLNMVDFYRNVKKAAKEYAARYGKPDVIYASSVHPLTLVAGIQLAKRFGVKCICEVRDLWPESIVAYSERFTRNNPVIRLLYRGEKWIYKKADALIFTMQGAYDYIVEKGWEKEIPREKVFCINNGVDLEDFEYNKENFTINDTDLQDTNTFKIVYAGSIRAVNNMGFLLDVAKQIDSPNVKFLIWGDGDQVEALKERVRCEGIDNVTFKGRVEKKYIPFVTSHSDLNVMDMQEYNELFRFGISPNKLFEYFAAEKPILMYQLNHYNPALEYGVGLVAENKDDLLIKIRNVIEAKGETEMQTERFKKAREAFSFSTLTSRLIQIIEEG